jgi:hypothetical protein
MSGPDGHFKGWVREAPYPKGDPWPSPEYMGISYRKKLIRSVPVDVYIGSNMATYWYPYRCQDVGHAWQRVRWTANWGYILDSDYDDDDVTNAQIIETALEVDPHFVVPKDYPGDPRRTFHSTVDFLDQWDDVDHPAKVLIPLQPPYEESYRAVDQYDYYALGGLKPLAPNEQVEHLKRADAVMDADDYVHAFGLGACRDVVDALRTDPDLVDSLDLSTPERMAKNQTWPDRDWTQAQSYVCRGEMSTIVRGVIALGIAMRLNYELSPLPNEEKEDHLAPFDPLTERQMQRAEDVPCPGN